MTIAKNDTEDQQKPNCFILTGLEWIPSRKKVGSDAIWDHELQLWCLPKESDAKEIVQSLKQEHPKARAQHIYSEVVKSWLHGSKSRKSAIKKRSLIAVKKSQLSPKELKFFEDCSKLGIDKSFLYDSPPQDWDEKQIKNHKYLLSHFETIRKLESEIIEVEKECEELEAKADKEESHPSINLDNWPFKVLGYNNNREILLWHKGEVMPIQVKQLGESDIKLLIGIDAPCDKVKEGIICQARAAGKIHDETPIKAGCWWIKGKWLVISGHRAAVIENNTLRELQEPIYEGKVLEHSNAEWLDWDIFKAAYEKPDLAKVFTEVHLKVLAWNWKYSEMADYATAFLFLSPLQHAMTWRPWIYLTGSKGTGKTSFFEHIVQEVYGELIERLDKSTAHAAAQLIGNSGKIPAFDEFEKHKHIPDVLELAKMFNKGGRKTSGTPGAKAHSFSLHHIAWFGSIYLPKQLHQDAAQESRMVKLELKKLKNGTPPLEKVDSTQGPKLAASIVGSMIRQWDLFEKGAQSINRERMQILEKIPGIEIRTVENFMYASTVLNQLLGGDRDVPNWAAQSIEDDSDRILSTILSSLIHVDHDEFSVAECLERARGEQTKLFSKALENHGLKHTNRNGVNYLAIRCQLVTRYLLKDTDYREMDIQAPLARTEGSISSHPVKIAGCLERCVLIPYDHIQGKDNDLATGGCNQRNPSVTSNVTPYIINNQIDRERGYTGYANEDTCIYENSENHEHQNAQKNFVFENSEKCL